MNPGIIASARFKITRQRPRLLLRRAVFDHIRNSFVFGWWTASLSAEESETTKRQKERRIRRPNIFVDHIRNIIENEVTHLLAVHWSHTYNSEIFRP